MNSDSRSITVLISAFACEADEGSEPEVGWSWAHEMAKDVSVVVLTQAKNRERIERWYAEHPDFEQSVTFEYFDLSEKFLIIKKLGQNFLMIYYLFWQWKVVELEKKLVDKYKIDVIHHTTFASFRYPIFWRHRPVVWGPVGGADNAPSQLLFSSPSLVAGLRELTRNIMTSLSAFWLTQFSKIPDRVGYAFGCTPRTNEVLQNAGIQSEVMPTISMKADFGEPEYDRRDSQGLKLLYVGRLHHLKGVHLLVEALGHIKGRSWSLQIIGSGPMKEHLQSQVKELNLEGKIEFLGQVPRVSLEEYYSSVDVLVAPSLYESGGLTVLESFRCGRPAIVLDCGGHAISVAGGCGVRVDPYQSRAEIVKGLAAAIEVYLDSPEQAVDDGRRAQARLKYYYSWQNKRERMLAAYMKCLK